MKARANKSRTLTKFDKLGPVTLTVRRFDLYSRNCAEGPFAIYRQTNYEVRGDGLGPSCWTREEALRRWNAVEVVS